MNHIPAGNPALLRQTGQKPYYLVQQLGVWQHPDQNLFMQVGGNTWAPKTITFPVRSEY